MGHSTRGRPSVHTMLEHLEPSSLGIDKSVLRWSIVFLSLPDRTACALRKIPASRLREFEWSNPSEKIPL